MNYQNPLFLKQRKALAYESLILYKIFFKLRLLVLEDKQLAQEIVHDCRNGIIEELDPELIETKFCDEHKDNQFIQEES